MLLVLWWCIAVALLDMMAEHAEQKLENLKRGQNSENDSETTKTLCKLNKLRRLRDKVFGAGDELLCRLLCIRSQPNRQSGVGERGEFRVGVRSKQADKLLQVSCGCGSKKRHNAGVFLWGVKKRVGRLCGFCGRHKCLGVTQPNDQSSATPGLRCKPRMRN